ncbi:kinase D-interacting substrate of 220 kDa-like isoform X3 [Varroa destructor]|uniref:Kinase D-interacting substrate of 220 kDa n=1 Tax=Varroa destructor TaxID=109461 RepID=A0A7M7J9Y6_VARDE|nr:kinase D-interacting substrate of 220 kDa-like isoform X3 [Varroa destructor]
MLKLSEYRLIRLSSEIEERLSIPATSASTAKPELLITPQEIFPTCLETQSQKTPSIIGGSEMLNPKDLRMSIRREKKQVHFDPSAQPQSKPSAMFEITAKWIRSGEIVSVRESLKNRSLNPEEKDENGQTLLMLAAQNGQASLCEDLLRHGWDPQAEDQDGWTALHNAAKEGFLDVAVLLVTHNASVDCRDGTGWTPLMWACYHGDTQIARFLIDNGAFVNVHDAYHMSALIWASGRGHLEIVEMLLQHGAKVNAGDKFGSTALIWAARKGSGPIVEKLLEHGANVDTAGMFSWTSLIVATKGNYVDIAGQLLEHRPNVNAVDADGYTALAICCKEGYTEIATRLLAAGAYVNMVDKGGDTNLIHAAKVGNLSVVDVLLKRHADIDIQGSDKKTALYWAVEKGHVEVVKSLLAHNPNLELATKDGDTPLMRATRNRNLELVTLLIERKNPAKGSACDKRGDTALHIAMRARSKAICEVLLRNPKNGHLLYRPNKSGETPYNIDAAQQKSILQQIFGARKLNTHEENENMLGYDLYSSSLADILSEPSLTLPITVGLYARWGSGKGFLLNKLENELRSYGFQWLEQSLKYTWVLFITVSVCSILLGYILVGVATQWWIVAFATSVCSVILSYGAFYLMRYGSRHYDWGWAFELGARLDELLADLKRVLQVLFCHPGSSLGVKDSSIPVRFIFASQTKVSSSGHGGASIAYLMVSMYQALEEEFGYFTTRLYRALRPKTSGSSSWTFRRMCCLPYWLVCVLTVLCLMVAVELLISSKHKGKKDASILIGLMISFASIVGVVFIANLYTWLKMAASLFMSYERTIHRYMARVDSSVQGGYSEVLKSEVKVICDLIHCMDSFMDKQTRLVIIVDGLDSCEQTKVLSVLDAVNVMLSDPGMPFVIILAVDPHIVIKAVESNVSRVIHNPSLSGFDYLRNIVHLPFYLQNSGLRKVRAAARSAQLNKRSMKDRGEEWEKDGLASRRVSNCSAVEIKTKRTSTKGNYKLRSSESIASSIGNIHQRSTGAAGGADLTKVLLNDDYFSDINPRSMRRLMNILHVTGRLMRAFNIDFNWYHLASWVNITEQWPCQASWLIHYCETHEQEVDDNVTLRALFDKIRVGMPMTKEIEELQNMDHDIKKMELCLSLNSQALQGFQRKVSTAHSLRNGPWGMSPLAADPRYLQGVVQQSAIQQQQQQTLQQPMYCTPQPYNPMMSPFMYYPPNSSNALPLPLLRQSGRPLSFPERLSAQTKDGICKMLSCLDGLSSANLSAYQESINKHNINGRVLLSCDLQELKVVLNMNFGDWEIFRMHILQLRAAEISALVESPLDESNGLGQQQQLHEWNDKTERQDRDSLGSHSRPSTAVKNDERGSERESSAKCHRKPPTAVKNTTSLEKQVTMEDSMILGALETLNEEAPEDGCHIRELGSVATSLSPILSDEESVPSPSESASSDPCPTPLCPQQVPASARLHVPSGDDGSNAELDFVYIHKTGNSRYSLNSLSTSVPDIEWGTGGGGNTGSAFSTSGGGASSGLAPTPAQGIAAPAAHGLSIPTQNATLVSAPPSIASSPSSGQPLVPARGSSPGLGQDPRALRNKLLDSVTGSPKTPRRNRDSAIKPPSSLTIVEGIPTEDEKKPLLSEMEPVDLPPRGVQPQSAESRRQHFGRQFSIKEDDVDRSSGRPQNASVTRSKSLASDARQEYEELSFSQKRLQREGGSFESAVVAITAGDAGSSASHFSGHSAQSARRSCAILRLHQQSGLTDDPRFKENERNLQEERKTKSTSASTETVI